MLRLALLPWVDNALVRNAGQLVRRAPLRRRALAQYTKPGKNGERNAWPAIQQSAPGHGATRFHRRSATRSHAREQLHERRPIAAGGFPERARGNTGSTVEGADEVGE